MYFYFFCITLISCRVNKVYNNREQDKIAAEIPLRRFYQSVRSNNYSQIFNLLSNDFKKSSDTSQLFKLINISKERLGNIDSMYLANWETSVIEGPNPNSNYSFVFIVFRQKSTSKETFKLLKERDSIKILSYNVDAKDLLGG